MEARIGGQHALCMLDCGSEVSVIRRSLVPRAWREQPTGEQLTTASGDSLRALGRVLLDVNIGGMQLSANFVVAPDTLLRPVILGMDWLAAHRVNWTFGERHAKIGGPAGAEAAVVYSKPPQPSCAPVALAGAAAKPGLQQLLAEFAVCFAADDAQYGRARVKPLVITLLDKSARPIRRPPYRVSPEEADQLDLYVDELVSAGVASVAGDDVEWAFPCKLVPRPDDPAKKPRFVVDMHQLTSLIKIGAYPAPDMEMLLMKLHGKSWYAKLDFQASFYQFDVDVKSRHLLGFVTPSGRHLVLNRVPMGLATSSGYLQKRLDEIFSGIADLHGYADDWWVASDTWDKFLATLREVLKRIKDTGLLLKPSKCVFGVQEMHLLGRIVTPAGIKPDPSNVSDIFAMRKPRTCEDVFVLLGRTQWVARFVPSYSAITAPLRPMLRKGADFAWTRECEEAWSSLKQTLTSAPLLAHPDWTEPFVLECDASSRGLGAVLLQGGRPVAYKSRALTPAELNLPITYLELLALTWAVEEWAHFLRRKFTIRTDHRSLQWIRDLRRPMGRLAQWAAILADFDFDVVYVGGDNMGLADGLSRLVAAVDTNHLLAAQAQDAVCEKIRLALEQETDAEPGQRLSDSYLRDVDGLLCKVDARYNMPVLRALVPASMVAEVLSAEHTNAAHPGRTRTLARIKSKYTWPTLEHDVREFVDTCDKCQRHKPGRTARKPGGSLAATAFNSLVSCDLLAGMRPGPGGEVAVLVITDHFSRLAAAVALKSKTSADTAAGFKQAWIAKHGKPRRLLTDQGPEFTGAAFSALCKEAGIKKDFTTAYHPQGDGVTERFNQTLKTRLGASLASADWPALLDKVCKEYNDEEHASTGYPPNLLAHDDWQLDGMRVDPADARTAAKTARNETQQAAKAKNTRAEESTKDSLSAPKFSYLRKGSQVLIRNLRNEPYSKFDALWSGPFRILSRPHRWTALCTPVQGGNAVTVNIANIKPYRRLATAENAQVPNGASPAGDGRSCPQPAKPHRLESPAKQDLVSQQKMSKATTWQPNAQGPANEQNGTFVHMSAPREPNAHKNAANVPVDPAPLLPEALPAAEPPTQAPAPEVHTHVQAPMHGEGAARAPAEEPLRPQAPPRTRSASTRASVPEEAPQAPVPPAMLNSAVAAPAQQAGAAEGARRSERNRERGKVDYKTLASGGTNQ